LYRHRQDLARIPFCVTKLFDATGDVQSDRLPNIPKVRGPKTKRDDKALAYTPHCTHAPHCIPRDAADRLALKSVAKRVNDRLQTYVTASIDYIKVHREMLSSTPGY
jgi:hypothetical protein